MTTTVRLLLIDDEDPARRLLREYLDGVSDVEIAGECANGFEAVKAVATLDPDLLLLDVQMPKLDGFEVLELIGKDIPVVFVTAYEEFSVRAFEVHAVDYLLKPFRRERLLDAIERARPRVKAYRGGSEGLPETAAAREVRAGRRPLDRILIRDGAQVHVVGVADVVYIEAEDDYVSIATRRKEKHLKQQTMGELEASLDPQVFVRIHRSFLLNIGYLARIEAFTKDARVAILSDGTQLPVSRSGYERLRALL